MIVVGKKIYERCGFCGQLVQMNKLLFGSLHICPERENAGKVPCNECGGLFRVSQTIPCPKEWRMSGDTGREVFCKRCWKSIKGDMKDAEKFDKAVGEMKSEYLERSLQKVTEEIEKGEK